MFCSLGEVGYSEVEKKQPRKTHLSYASCYQLRNNVDNPYLVIVLIDASILHMHVVWRGSRNEY